MADPATTPIRYRGINHLALVTNDMDMTVRYYVGVLGMRLVATTMAGPMRHYFFDMGAEHTIAFFEMTGMERFAKQAGGPPPPFPIQLDHISFNVPDEHALETLRARLRAHGSEVTDVVDHGFVRSIYFTDPNGISLEASWWAIDATGREADYDDGRLFEDPDPVPAVGELRTQGRVTSAPVTRLVGDEILDPA